MITLVIERGCVVKTGVWEGTGREDSEWKIDREKCRFGKELDVWLYTDQYGNEIEETENYAVECYSEEEGVIGLRTLKVLKKID